MATAHKGIPLADFQQLVGLSDGALLWLLKEGVLPCEATPEGRVHVLLDAVQSDSLARELVKRRAAARPPTVEILIEQCGELLTRRIQDLANEVLANAGPRRG